MYPGDYPFYPTNATTSSYKRFKTYYDDPNNRSYLLHRFSRYKFMYINYCMLEHRDSSNIAAALDGTFRPFMMVALCNLSTRPFLSLRGTHPFGTMDLRGILTASARHSLLFGASLFAFIYTFRTYRDFYPDQFSAYPFAGLAAALPAAIVRINSYYRSFAGNLCAAWSFIYNDCWILCMGTF